MKEIKIAVIDDELNPLKIFLENVVDRADVQCRYFMNDPGALMRYVEESSVDAVFLDINMPVMNGVDLAERIKGVSPRSAIVFISAYTQDEEEIRRCIGGNLLGFCYKPYSRGQIEQIFDRIESEGRNAAGIRFRTFGQFDMFKDGRKLEFTSPLCKEFLAYLVDRAGATVTCGEISAVLWPDKDPEKAKMRYRNVKSLLRLFLREHGIEYLLSVGYGSCSIVKKYASCDMWDYLADASSRTYDGEYLISYGWSMPRQNSLDVIRSFRERGESAHE